MKQKNWFLFVLILLLFKCRKLYGQLNACNLNTIDYGQNICDTSNYLVYISKSVCGTNDDTNCWCIIVDNRNQIYDGQLVEIEVDQSFRVTWTRAIRTNPELANILELKFTITSGINRIYLEPYTSSSPEPRLVTFKIDANEICTTLYRRKKQVYVPYQDEVYIEPNDIQIQFTPQGNPSQQAQALQGDRYRFLNDCVQTASYTENSERFCRNDDGSNNFIIEKRSLGRGERYWCISVSNERNRLSTSNRLRFTFESQYKFLAWIPSDAYIQQDSDDSNFHLGNQRTTIAVSGSSGKLTGLTAVTIDGQSICNYFTPTPTRKPPPPRTTTTTTTFYVPPIQNVVTDYYPVVTPKPEVAETSEPQNKPTFNQNCGIKPAKRVTLISYGASTTPGEWPWHAAIYKLQSKTNRNYICGGTLIDRKTIITAAHCVLDLNLIIIPDRIIVELGRHDLSTASSAIQEFKVFDVKPHELYNPDTIENDIAILVLANYVQLTTYVNYICLPQSNMELQKKIGKTVGWGRDENNQLQTELKEASMPVIDNIVCLSSNREFFGNFLTNTNFCAGYRNNTNVCRGDSGGGLVFNIGKQWFLGGVTSLGVSSKSTEIECDITQYAIFTDVTKFVTWIKQNS